MPTSAQLQAEPYWNREIVTVELDWLGDELCRRTKRPRTAFGSKGNTAHLRGAHRSQEWIKKSRYCTNRTYTVQAGLTAEQERHIAGADFTPGEWGTDANRRLMVTQTRRLVAALKAGRLAGVREVIGTLDGRTVVGTRPDGSTFSSDSSHLDHWHLTLDRRRCRDKQLMARIIATALGEDQEDDVSTADAIAALETVRPYQGSGPRSRLTDPTRYPPKGWANQSVRGLLEYIFEGSLGTSAELTAAKLRQEAILAKLDGQDSAQILARIDAAAAADADRHAELVAQLGAQHAEMRELVEQLGRGELAVDEFVRVMGEKLAAAPAGSDATAG